MKSTIAILLAVASAVSASVAISSSYLFGFTGNAIYKFNWADASPICYQPYPTSDRPYTADISGRFLFTTMTVDGETGVYMIDTTTFARKKIDTATEVLGVDGNYVYTQTIQDGMLVKQIKFLDAWMGVETEIKQFLFPMTFMSVRLGHSHLISKYARDSNRYVVVKTATMTGYELDLENSHEYTIGLIHIGIIDHVGKKIKLYSHNGTLVNAIDFSNEKTWDYGTRFWVERYPGMRPITNVGVIDITEGPFSVLIQAGSDGLEVLRGPNRFKFIRSDAQGQHDPYGVFGSMPYGLLRDGLNKLGVWRMGEKCIMDILVV